MACGKASAAIRKYGISNKSDGDLESMVGEEGAGVGVGAETGCASESAGSGIFWPATSVGGSTAGGAGFADGSIIVKPCQPGAVTHSDLQQMISRGALK